MAIIVPGKSECPLCGRVLAASERLVATSHFIGDPADHFFVLDEVELDFEPSAIDGPKALDSLVNLVAALGRASGRRVHVTPENCSDKPFLTYSPAEDEVVLVARE